jgi:hypothetical protein
MWALALGASFLGSVGAAPPNAGFLSPSVCVSPLVFGALILTPTATLSDMATKALKQRAGGG